MIKLRFRGWVNHNFIRDAGHSDIFEVEYVYLYTIDKRKTYTCTLVFRTEEDYAFFLLNPERHFSNLGFLGKKTLKDFEYFEESKVSEKHHE